MAVLKYSLLTVIILILIFPLYWMIQGSFLDSRGIMWMPPRLIPKEVTLANYKTVIAGDAVKNYYLLNWAGNTIIIISLGVVLVIAVTMPAGYAFSVFKFKGRQSLFWLFISSTMLHAYMLIVPMFVVVQKLGLPLRLAAVLPLAFSPMYVFFAKNFIDNIPRSLLDSAEIDGAGELRKIFLIVLPISKPLIGLLTLWGGLSAFGDFLWQLLLFQQLKNQTLIVGLIQWARRAQSSAINQIGVQLAAGSLLFVCMFIIFCFTAKYFTKGLNLQGVKE